jgi:hypothetical protein
MVIGAKGQWQRVEPEVMSRQHRAMRARSLRKPFLPIRQLAEGIAQSTLASIGNNCRTHPF